MTAPTSERETPSEGVRCCGCGGPVYGLYKPCDCATSCAYRPEGQWIVTVGGCTIVEWGTIMRSARRASHLALEKIKKDAGLNNPMNAAIMLYTDDPTTAAMFASATDMAEICGCSQIEAVATIMGERFPPDASEGERSDAQYPRVAALAFYARGSKCLRCRKFCEAASDEGLCARCETVLSALDAHRKGPSHD